MLHSVCRLQCVAFRVQGLGPGKLWGRETPAHIRPHALQVAQPIVKLVRPAHASRKEDCPSGEQKPAGPVSSTGQQPVPHFLNLVTKSGQITSQNHAGSFPLISAIPWPVEYKSHLSFFRHVSCVAMHTSSMSLSPFPLLDDVSTKGTCPRSASCRSSSSLSSRILDFDNNQKYGPSVIPKDSRGFVRKAGQGERS